MTSSQVLIAHAVKVLVFLTWPGSSPAAGGGGAGPSSPS